MHRLKRPGSDGRSEPHGKVGVVAAPRKYANEFRKRAQRLVAEARAEDPGMSLNHAVLRIGPRLGVNPDTLRGWCKQAAVDRGEQSGTTSGEHGGSRTWSGRSTN